MAAMDSRTIFVCRRKDCGRVVAARESGWCHGVPMDRVEVVSADRLREAEGALEGVRDALRGREISTADAWFAYDCANDYLKRRQ
jgi:hypothetical protein